MRSLIVLAGLIVTLLPGCAHQEDVQWMKVDQSYTSADFRRDYAACSRGVRLDEACMRERGWVSVRPEAEKPPAPNPYDRR